MILIEKVIATIEGFVSLCKGCGDHTWYQRHSLYWFSVKVNVMTSAINLTVITKL